MTDERKESGLVERFAGHTPGPWVADWNEYEVEIYAERIADNGHVFPELDEFYIYLDGEWMGQYPLSEANARLIAAAPELLDALIARDTEIERLRDALRPFAEHEAFHAPDDWAVTQYDTGDGHPTPGVTAGDFRRAKDALAASPPREQENG